MSKTTRTNEFLNTRFLSRLFIRSVLFLFLLLAKSGAWAQTLYPVQVAPQILPPYTLMLSEYYNSTAPRFQVMLINKDLLQPTVRVVLRMTITSSKVSLRTNDNAIYPPITLDAGIPKVISGVDLAPYFNPSNIIASGMSQAQLLNGKLDEGFYKFCFEVLDYNTKQLIGKSECTMASISLNEVPMLNTPANNADVISADPTSIFFSWTPMHQGSANAALTTNYEFTLVEMLDPGVSPENAIRNTKPLFTTIVSTPAFIYDYSRPQLVKNRRYAWRVRAFNSNGVNNLDEFKNGGYTQTFSFTYREPCYAPMIVTANVIPGRATINWWPVSNKFEYEVQYRNSSIAGDKWKTVTLDTTTLEIENLAAGKVYQYQVGVRCYMGGPLSYSPVQTFTFDSLINPKLDGVVRWGYHNSEETSDNATGSLVVTNPVEASVRTVNDFGGESTRTYPAPNVNISITARNIVNKKIVNWNTTTDANGRYELDLSKLEGWMINWRLNFAVSSSSGVLTETASQDVMIDPDKTRQAPSFKLTANSFRIKPTVTLTSPYNATATIEYLIRKDVYDAMPEFKNAGLGVGSPTIRYNNDSYVSLASMNNAGVFKKLLVNRNGNESYVARVTIPGSDTFYFPLSPVLGVNVNGKPAVQLVTRNFAVNNKTWLQGAVTIAGRPVSALLGIRIKREAILSTTDTVSAYLVVTNEKGFYSVPWLPALKKLSANEISVTIIAPYVRPLPYQFDVKYEGGKIIQQNFKITNPVFTVVGRVADQDDVPVANALVNVKGTGMSARTTTDGFYHFKLYSDSARTLEFIADGYTDANKTRQISIQPADQWLSGDDALSAEQWDEKIRNLPQVKAYLAANPGAVVNGKLIGLDDRSLVDIFNTLYPSTEEAKCVKDLGIQKLTQKRGSVRINALLNNKPVRALLTFSNGLTATTNSGSSYVSPQIKIGDYSVEVQATTDGETFVTQEAQFSITLGNVTELTLKLEAGVRITGRVSVKGEDEPIDSASIITEGLPHETSTDSGGIYTFIIPKGREYMFNFSGKGFNAVDTTIFVSEDLTVNMQLPRRDSTVPEITHLGGFEVNVKKAVKGTASDIFVISGTLDLPESDIFEVDAGYETLTFKDVTVRVEGSDAIPTSDVLFQEATISAKAFEFLPVEIAGQNIIMSNVPNTKKEKDNWVIGGSYIKARFTSINSNTAVGTLALPDGMLVPADEELRDAELNRIRSGKGSFKFAFGNEDTDIPGFDEDMAYNIKFFSPTVSRNISLGTPAEKYDTAKFIKTDFSFFADGYFTRETALVSHETGLQLEGLVKFNAIVGAKLPDSGKVEILRLQLGKDYSVKELTLKVSRSTPLKLKMQKVEADITSLSVYGLGTPNMGAGFGGVVRLLKGSKDSLVINRMSVINSKEGLMLSANVSPGDPDGMNIKGLNFKPGSDGIALEINASDKSLHFATAGELTYKKRGASGAQEADSTKTVSSSIFPLTIEKFDLNTKNWSLFLQASSNKKIDLKVGTLAIERFMVNVGYRADLDEMLEGLETGTPPEANSGADEEVPDEQKTNWALGFKGTMEMPIKGIKGSVGGTVVVGSSAAGIDYRIGEIDLVVEAPSFTVAAKAKISLSGPKKGFEAAATLTTLNKTMDATFKYYKIEASELYPNGGTELGASIKANANFATGPLFWHAIGGGFDFNTATQQYKLFLTGDVGTTSTPKNVFYVKDATLSVLFDTKNCGTKPTIDASGKMIVKNDDWGTVGLKADFCKELLLVTVDGNAPVAGTTVYVKGVLFGIKPKGDRPGAVFLGVNANIQSMGDMMKGNAFIGLGLNYDNTSEYAPLEARNLWPNVHALAKSDEGRILNGICVTGYAVVPSRSGTFSIGMFGVNAVSYNYSFDANARVVLASNFTNSNFLVQADVNGNASASFKVLTLKASGSVAGSLKLAGGRQNNQWYGTGQASFTLQIKAGSNKDNCGDWGMWGPGFKSCKSLNASISARQNQSTSVNFSLN